MKTFKLIIFIVATLLMSVVTFFTFNLLLSAVSNYAAMTKVIFSLFPMLMFMCILITLMVAGYYYHLKKRRDIYFVRQYSITIASMALVGIVFSIVSGTYVYHGFFKDYIFNAYPFMMLLVHSIFFIGATNYAVSSIIKIKKENPERTFIAPKLYGLRMAALILIYVYALERLGAFALLPNFYSDVDGALVIPYYIQLLIPALILTTYVIHEDFLRNRKVTLILSSVAFGYSLFSMIYMLIISHGTYPLTINPLSAINQFERLVKYPISYIFIYGISLLIPFLNGLNNTLMIIKEKKAK